MCCCFDVRRVEFESLYRVLDVYCFGESISLSPSCGAQNWWSLLLVATNFDRCANSHSLHHPQGAVVFVARAVTGDRFKLSFKAKQKEHPKGCSFCLAQKERHARLCLAFATQTTDCVRLRRVEFESLYQLIENKK